MKRLPTNAVSFALVVGIVSLWTGMGTVIALEGLWAHGLMWITGTVLLAVAYLAGARVYGWRWLWEQL